MNDCQASGAGEDAFPSLPDSIIVAIIISSCPVMTGPYVVEQLSRSESNIEAESLDPSTDGIVQWVSRKSSLHPLTFRFRPL